MTIEIHNEGETVFGSRLTKKGNIRTVLRSEYEDGEEDFRFLQINKIMSRVREYQNDEK